MDWHSRRVLSWRVSNTMDAAFCTDAPEKALARHGTPEVFNTDQGSQGGFKWSSQHPDATSWTKVRNLAWTCPVLWFGADAEHDPDVLVVDLDPPHQGEDEVTLGRPICLVQPVADQGRECFQLADDELQRMRLLGGVLKRCGIGFELGDAPAQARQPRLEFGLADHALGVAVDQPADAAAQLRELALECLQLGPVRPGAHGLQAAPAFLGDAGRFIEQSAHLGPDRRVQRLDRQRPSLAAALAIEAGAVRPGAAIVAVAGSGRTHGRLPAAAQRVAAGLADQQALEQEAHAAETLAPPPPVLVRLRPHLREQRGVDQRRDRDVDPLLGRGQEAAARAFGDRAMAARRSQRRPPRGRGEPPEAGSAGIGGVGEQRRDHAPLPARVAGRAGHAGLEQPLADHSQADALLADPAEDAPDHRGLVLDHLKARHVVPGLAAADVAVAVGCPAQHADRAGLGPVAFAAPAALDDARAFVFGEHALQLQQQGVLRRLPDRTVEGRHLGASARELLDQHRLVRIRAGQAVGRVHVEDVNGPHHREVAQPLQRGPDQAGAALAVVEEAQLGSDLVPVGCRARQQRRNLAVDGVALSLLIGRHPGVDRRPDRGYQPHPRRGRRLPLHHPPPLSYMRFGQGGPGATASAAGAGRRPSAPPARPAAARSPPPG